MSAHQFWSYLAQLSPKRRREWLAVQTRNARLLVDEHSLREKSADVVQLTAKLIMENKPDYVNSNNLPFDDFFRFCLKKTVKQLRRKASTKKRIFESVYYDVVGSKSGEVDFRTRPIVEIKQERQEARESLAALVSKAGLQGTNKRYAMLLRDIGWRGLDQDDVANMLGVKKDSLAKSRTRIGGALSGKPEKK